MKPIGLQLYTLRKDVYPGGDDLPGVLRTVAEIGYKGVEMAGLHGRDPKEIAGIIGDLGLRVTSSHTEFPTPENVGRIAETELALDNTRVITGGIPGPLNTVDGCKEAAAVCGRAAELLKPYGISFGIHNHWAEFFTVDGRHAYDILMEEAPDVFGELDVYWCAYGKADPVKVISRYKSRLPLLHIKDGTLEDNAPHKAVGSGVLDMPAIIGAADPNVLEWLIVELDTCATDMLEAVKQSYRYLTSQGLALGNK